MKRNRRGIFYGWWVVLTAAVALFWGIPVIVYSFSIFLKPLALDLHATRSAVSFAYTLRAIVDALSYPVVGWLIGRFGSRRLILPAAVMFGLVLLSIKIWSGGIGQFYVFYVLLGLGGIGLGPLAFGNVVSCWFDRRRGLALGVAMLGIGCGAMMMPIFAQHLIANFGWRNSYAILGLAVLLIPVPVIAALLKEKPRDLGLLPDGATPVDYAATEDLISLGMSASETWRSRTFWLMVCAFFLVGAGVQGCVVHTAAILSDRGMSLQTAALGSSLLGAAVMIGRVGTGYLLDRYFAPRVAALSFACAAAGMGLFLEGGASTAVFLGVFFIGLGLGAEIDVIPFLISRYFGLRSFAQIYSVALGIFVLAGAVGPLLMGAGFDLTGSYRTPLAALFISTLLATVLIAQLGPYRYHARRPEENASVLQVQVGEQPCGPVAFNSGRHIAIRSKQQ
jgi:MFS family permease